MSQNITESMRVQKWLSHAGYCSRRAAEELMLQKKVLIDGVVATPGDFIHPGQTVTVHGAVVTPADTEKVLLLYHKPIGVECTMSHIKGVTTLADIPFEYGRIFNIGRLDRASRGLLLMTNDGQRCYELSHPKHNHKKVYQVTVDKPITQELLDIFHSGGVRIGTNTTRPAQAQKSGDNTLTVTLTEGRNRQIRHTCTAAGYTVVDLFRTQFGDYTLGDLPEGRWKVA